MARLPDYTALGRPAVPVSERPLSGYRAGMPQQAAEEVGLGIARAGQEQGEALAGIGQSVARTGQAIQDVADRQAAASAMQTFISKKLQLDQQFQSDQDYQTAPQRYNQAISQAAQDATATIPNAAMRADFQDRMARWVEFGTSSMQRQSHAKWVDQGRGTTVDAINVGIDQALKATDEPTRAAAFQAIHDRIDGAEASGWFTHVEAAKLRQTVPQQYAAKRGAMAVDADPEAAVAALRPSGLSADGTPTFQKTGDWRDFLDPAKRMELLRLAQRQATALTTSKEIAAERAQRLQDKAERDHAEAAANDYVTQLTVDPTKVDPVAIANDPRFAPSQWRTKEALVNLSKAALAKDDGKDIKTYGPGFYQAYQAVHAAPDDPNRITDPAQLYSRVGPNGDLTVAGVKELTSEIQAKRTPEGEAEGEMKKAFLATARAQITGTNEGLHLRDPKGDELYLKFLATALPAYDAGRKAGKSPAQLLNPDSPDYIGKSIASFKRPMSQWTKDMLADNAPEAASPSNAPDLTTRDGIVAAYHSGRLSREDAAAALVKGGFAAPAAPPTPSAPIAAEEAR